MYQSFNPSDLRGLDIALVPSSSASIHPSLSSLAQQSQLLDDSFRLSDVSGNWSCDHSILSLAQSQRTALLNERPNLSQVSDNWSRAESTFAIEHPSVENALLLDLHLSPLRNVRVDYDPIQYANARSVPRPSKQGSGSHPFGK